MGTLYLMFEHSGDLSGFQPGPPVDELAAQREARRLLAADLDLAAIEIWRGGELLEAVRS